MDKQEFDLLLVKANNGDNDAKNKLHDLYATSDFVTKIFKECDIEKYLMRPCGSYTLFHAAFLTFVLTENKKIEAYLIESMDAGCSQANILLAFMIESNIIKSEKSVNELINASKKMQNSNAYIKIADETDDRDKKIKLLKKAIKLGNRLGYHEIGLYYHDNDEFKLAKKYYEKSIASGIDRSYFNLAVMYRYGTGVDKDSKRAMQLFKTARKRGCCRAATNIGTTYLEIGNKAKAQKYFMEAINNGDSLACYNFGLMHKGTGNTFEAMRCFVEGAKRGDDLALKETIKFGIFDLDASDAEIKQYCDLYDMTKYFGANDYY